VQSITHTKFQTLSVQKYTTSPITAEIRNRQLDCLAINIYREAGYEPFEGKVAVAQVTLNRVDHPGFANDICGVVYEKTKAVKVICQFSWYCDSAHRNRPLGPGYKESYEVAKKVLLEGFRLSSMKDALFYHADYVNPKWGKQKIAKIGAHIFYSNQKAGA
jgi:spore germination cell wall hydrolase CwlJ-like protein